MFRNFNVNNNSLKVRRSGDNGYDLLGNVKKPWKIHYHMSVFFEILEKSLSLPHLKHF